MPSESTASSAVILGYSLNQSSTPPTICPHCRWSSSPLLGHHGEPFSIKMVPIEALGLGLGPRLLMHRSSAPAGRISSVERWWGKGGEFPVSVAASGRKAPVGWATFPWLGRVPCGMRLVATVSFLYYSYEIFKTILNKV
jgi:hypothetical protein